MVCENDTYAARAALLLTAVGYKKYVEKLDRNYHTLSDGLLLLRQKLDAIETKGDLTNKQVLNEFKEISGLVLRIMVEFGLKKDST